jgi:hypothetical protein
MACTSKPKWQTVENQNGKQIQVLKDKTGKLIGKKIMTNDSNYVYLKFGEKGELVDSINFVNNKREGLRIYLYENKVYYETYHRGALNGLQQALYANGVAGYVGHLKNGTKIGEWKFFYDNGNPITYEFYDNQGKLLYFLKYKEDGTIKEKKGSEIIDLHIDKTNPNFGDTLTVSILLAYPPNGVENTLLLSNSREKNKALQIPVSEPETFFQIVADKKGKTEYIIDYHWKNKEEKEINSSHTNFQLDIN